MRLIKTLFIAIFYLTCGTVQLHAQDTFSIVAVDPVTGEIGSAGASCLNDTDILGGVTIISDIIPGLGAIHTQSFWHIGNQVNAHDKMVEGLSPQEIIDWLLLNDIQNNPQIRQYGIVDLIAGEARSAAFTGTECFDVKEHVTGPTYAIQGNILLNDEIIDGMENAFVNTVGTLAERLMATLQAANIPGADSRCLEEGVSSQSAFVRVARPNDEFSDLYLDLAVTLTPYGVEPIDSLQVLFDEWTSNTTPAIEKSPLSIYPNPAQDEIHILGLPGDNCRFEIRDLQGRTIKSGMIPSSGNIPLMDLNAQVVMIRIYDHHNQIIHTSRLVLN
jgi:uncharacterized Ntn-hydrolase superfamily protein